MGRSPRAPAGGSVAGPSAGAARCLRRKSRHSSRRTPNRLATMVASSWAFSARWRSRHASWAISSTGPACLTLVRAVMTRISRPDRGTVRRQAGIWMGTQIAQELPSGQHPGPGRAAGRHRGRAWSTVEGRHLADDVPAATDGEQRGATVVELPGDLTQPARSTMTYVVSSPSRIRWVPGSCRRSAPKFSSTSRLDGGRVSGVGVLRLHPWHLRVFPGEFARTGGQVGQILTWQEGELD